MIFFDNDNKVLIIGMIINTKGHALSTILSMTLRDLCYFNGLLS